MITENAVPMQLTEKELRYILGDSSGMTDLEVERFERRVGTALVDCFGEEPNAISNSMHTG